jgi:histidyl-tRNA synthetase
MGRPGLTAAVRGFPDVLPEDSRRWQALEEAARALFAVYGFGEIRLPVLERTELFARSVGEGTDIVEKEMYSFIDRDGTSVTLRPEATASVIRAYLERGLAPRDPQARLFYVGPMFRRERPQRGRYRQFHQIGAEALGRDDPLVDAELLVFISRYLEAVGARGVRLELTSLGDEECRPAYRDRLRAFAEGRRDRLCPDCQRRLERNPLRLLDCKVEGCRAAMADAPLLRDHLCGPCRDHLAAVQALLDSQGIAHVMNFRIVRGLDYYRRTAFELVAEGLGAQNAIGAGGRYDGLVAALGGPDIGGIGFALGLERLALVATTVATTVAGPAAVILPLSEPAVPPALGLATRLRHEGVAVDLEPAGRSLKALLRSAGRRGARLALILGDDELGAGRATVRDLLRHEDRRHALPLDAPAPELARAVAALVAGNGG